MKKLVAGLLGLVFVFGAGARAQESAPAHASRNPDIFKLLRLDGNLVRWRNPRGGVTTITYRLLDKFQAFDGARNCQKMTGIDDLTARSQLDGAHFRAALSAAFAMWEHAADLKFREAQANETANIVIGAQQNPEGWAFADVFYDASSQEAVKPISLALVCLNPTRLWKVGFNGDLKIYDLRYTLAHEIGHAIGLDHPNAAGQVMGYRYEENFSELQVGDVSGAATIYGSPRNREQPSVAASPLTPPKVDRAQSSLTSRALNPKPD